MDSSPDSNPAEPRPGTESSRPARRRNISWVVLCAVLFVPGSIVGLFLIGMVVEFLGRHDLRPGRRAELLVPAAMALLLVTLAWQGIRRGWNTPRAVSLGWKGTTVLLAWVALMFLNSFGKRMRPASVDKAVLNNARQLAAAADQYFLETGATTCTRLDLVGPTNYVKALHRVSDEAYPYNYTKGAAITITGVAGIRTITYAP